MARSFAAITPARAHSLQGLARSLAHPTYLKLVDAEPWLRRLEPVSDMEDAMLDIMYDVPSRTGVKEVVVNEEVIMRGEAPIIVYSKEKEAELA